MLKKIGTVAALLVALIASGAFLVARAAPERRPALPTPPVQQAAGGAFVATCKANEVVDTRPDPVWVDASFANDNCTAPIIPARFDGYSASIAQVNQALAAEKNYEGVAKTYQRCIQEFVSARSGEAQKRKMSMDVSLVTIENHRIAASQADIKKAYALVALEVDQFNELGSECPE